MIEIGPQSDKRKTVVVTGVQRASCSIFLVVGATDVTELLILRLLFLLHLIPLQPDWSQMTGFSKS